TGGVGESLDATVIAVVAPVKGGLLDALALGVFGQLFADGHSRLHVAAVGRFLPVAAAGGRQRYAVNIVDELRVNMFRAAEDAEARALGRADDVPAHVPAPPEVLGAFRSLLASSCR